MKNKYIVFNFLVLAAMFIGLAACSDVWNDHNKLVRSDLSKNLLQEVQQDTSLSLFAKYLKSSGLESVLENSTALTVWAPKNSAFAQLTAELSDTTALKAFIKNHLSYQSTFTTTANTQIKLLSGKNVAYNRDLLSIGGAQISDEVACKNGVLHTISAIIAPPLNSWEYVLTQSASSYSKQLAYLNLLTHKVFSASLSTQTGVNASGETTYDSVWVNRNYYLNDIADLSNEDSVYTFFVLNDDAYEAEYGKLKPYLADTVPNYSQTSVSNLNTQWTICKDLVVRGKYLPGQLPDTLVSVSGIKIPSSAITIESSFESSNGIVHYVKRFSIPLKNKIPTVTLEGENYSSTFNDGFVAVSVPLLGIRARSWASGERDLFIPGSSTGHKIAYLSVKYTSPYLYTTKYKVVWRAVNDFQTTSFTQKLALNVRDITDIKSQTYLNTDLVTDSVVKFRTITYLDYSEHDLGRVTTRHYSPLSVYVVANATTTNNPIVIDYIKLIPILPE